MIKSRRAKPIPNAPGYNCRYVDSGDLHDAVILPERLHLPSFHQESVSLVRLFDSLFRDLVLNDL